MNEIQQLFEDGYCIIKNILTPEILSELRLAGEELSHQQQEHLMTLGVPLTGAFLKLATWKPTLDVLCAANLDPKYYMGVFINKKPHEPKRCWHQDWWCWNNPISKTEMPVQIGIMYYFNGSTKENGCLRVIPGSHHKWFPPIHENYLNGNFTMADYPEERAIEMTPEDVLLMDSRLLHSTYENKTNQNRLAVNLWHISQPNNLPPDIYSWISTTMTGYHGILPPDMLLKHNNQPPIQVSNETYRPKKEQMKEFAPKLHE